MRGPASSRGPAVAAFIEDRERLADGRAGMRGAVLDGNSVPVRVVNDCRQERVRAVEERGDRREMLRTGLGHGAADLVLETSGAPQ